MIKRENIAQAIDAISARDAEIGYSLNEMLATGQIDVPDQLEDRSEGDEFYFLFDKEKVSINKFLYFNEGTVPIEQSLLIKYGEMTKKEELQLREDSLNYMQAVKEIREAGLRLMVTHEIGYAIARLRRRLERPESDPDIPGDEHLIKEKTTGDESLIWFLEQVKDDAQAPETPREESDPAVLYRGVVDDFTPALFTHFPYRMDSLMQVADMNLEFFHVRFLLNCMVRGLEKNLFICLVDRKILGLVYLTLKERLFYRGLEIQFMATLRGKTDKPSEPSHQAPRGVGAFLVAGVWMLWKTGFVKVKEICLDSEIGSRPFYDAIGFQPRGLAGYVLKDPKGHLLKAILTMANNCQDLEESLVEEIEALIRKQIRFFRKKAKSQEQRSRRNLIIATIKECLKAEAHPEFAKTAISTLIKYKEKIPESGELLRFALEHGSDETKAVITQ
ncbi:MAG: hypothetical protein ISS66_06460 [Desulfobacteraceae bacterium]|nr:hypothetical protein [Desulfobacteraceae bacterium]